MELGKCEWCGRRKAQERHHYPIPKIDGGKEAVVLCLACHRAYHGGMLIGVSSFNNKEEIEAKTLKAAKRLFPLLGEVPVDIKITMLNMSL